MLNLVTARSRTRGKTPKEFTFQAVGRLKARNVEDKDGNPILVDEEGKQVKYSLVKKDEKSEIATELPFQKTESGDLIAPEGTRFLVVDDVETSGLTDSMQEVLDLFGTLTEDERGKRTVNQFAIDALLDGFNYQARKNAAPVTEQVTEDELTPITLALVEKKILSDTDATTWRRTITSSAKLMEMNRLDFATKSPQYKKLLASGWKPAEKVA